MISQHSLLANECMHDILSLSLAPACGENAMDEGWGMGFGFATR